MPKKKVSNPERKFVVTAPDINNVAVTSSEFSDIEMIGILTLLLDAYKAKFLKGGQDNAAPESE